MSFALVTIKLCVIVCVLYWYTAGILKLMDGFFKKEFNKYLDQDSKFRKSFTQEREQQGNVYQGLSETNQEETMKTMMSRMTLMKKNEGIAHATKGSYGCQQAGEEFFQDLTRPPKEPCEMAASNCESANAPAMTKLSFEHMNGKNGGNGESAQCFSPGNGKSKKEIPMDYTSFLHGEICPSEIPSDFEGDDLDYPDNKCTALDGTHEELMLRLHEPQNLLQIGKGSGASDVMSNMAFQQSLTLMAIFWSPFWQLPTADRYILSY